MPQGQERLSAKTCGILGALILSGYPSTLALRLSAPGDPCRSDVVRSAAFRLAPNADGFRGGEGSGMSIDKTVSLWIADLKAGDSLAAQELWDRYFRRLVGLSRRILENAPRRAADEEDVALSAFKSFCQRASTGKFPQLEDRDDLWKILMTITIRKAHQLARKERRGPGKSEFDLVKDQIAGRDPTPAFAALVNDELARLLHLLDDEKLQQTAVLKLEGHNNKEIAERLARSLSYVERKLRLIRRVWSREGIGGQPTQEEGRA